MIHPALALAELGYRVFPCGPGGKRPITTHGLHDASSDPEQIEQWLAQHPTANWGLCTDGMLVIDIDPGAECWPGDDQLARELAATPVITLTPREGKHFYFRQPPDGDYRNTQNGQLADHVDTRGNGGYVMIPPSVVNGKAYQWANGDTEIGPAELPIVPQWICDALNAAKRPTISVAADPGDGTIPDGQRNGYLTKLAGAMRRVDASEADILAALEHANATRCKPPLDADEVATIAHSVARYAPADVANSLAQLEAAEQVGDDQSPNDPGTLPASLLSVPGFIAEVVAFNLAGAHRKQPALALAGALSLLATLTGRKVTDSQGTRTNLYCLGVAGTSMGKERARTVNKEILFAAGLPGMVGSESIGSAQGLITAVENQPAILFQLDEIGRYLRTMNSAREAYLYNIPSVLMRLFTSSASVYIGDAVVSQERIKTIEQPHACIYGTTTPGVLFESLSADSITDGFLSRLLIFEGDENAPKRRPVVPSVPASLIEQVCHWGAFKPGGLLADKSPQPIIVDSTASARSILYEFDTTAEAEQQRLGEPLGSLWPRACEKANKLALLYACSENAARPLVSDAAASWAVELVTHLTARLAYLASRYVSENRQESNVKRLARIIEAAGAEGIDKTGLTRASRWLTIRERDECLNTLIQSGECQLVPIQTGGRTRSVYTHRKYLALAA